MSLAFSSTLGTLNRQPKIRDEDSNDNPLAQGALINEPSNLENLFGMKLSWTCCSRDVLPLFFHETVHCYVRSK